MNSIVREMMGSLTCKRCIATSFHKTWQISSDEHCRQILANSGIIRAYKLY